MHVAQAIRRVGLDACEGILAFEEGEFDKCLSLIHKLRPLLQEVGASHAQRDIVVQYANEAARRSDAQRTSPGWQTNKTSTAASPSRSPSRGDDSSGHRLARYVHQLSLVLPTYFIGLVSETSLLGAPTANSRRIRIDLCRHPA
jgi:hypothetical protein